MNQRDNLELNVARFIIEKTTRSLFLTGSAGTGKTTFIRDIHQHTKKRHVILAPTGVAAINVGGMTIHSFFQFGFGPFLPGISVPDISYKIRKEKQELIQALELIIIDEISMVRADLLDHIDYELRRIRKNDLVFGGVQLLLIGDLRQLPPVVKSEEAQILQEAYQTNYFFGSKALEKIDYHIIELKTIYRQQDERFQDLLNRVRTNNITTDDLVELNSRYQPLFNPTENDYIRLVTHVRMAQDINATQLANIDSEEYRYAAQVTGNFPDDASPADNLLILKMGAQVMFVKNDPDGHYINGTIGEISFLDENNIRVQIGPDYEVDLEPMNWKAIKYTYNRAENIIEEEVIGSFDQYPIKLAWAITIHKSQGLTFDKVIINAQAAFTHGQTYVALSRCRTLEGIILSSRLNRRAFISDSDIDNYLGNKTDITRLAELVEYTPFEYDTESDDRRRPLTQAEKDLMTALKRWRITKAREKGVAAFAVLYDRSIDGIVRTLPRNNEGLKQVAGIGPRKIEEYGNDILDFVNLHRQNIIAPAPIQSLSKESATGRIPTRQLTFNMFKSGKTVAEIAEARSLTENTIQNHLVPYVQSGEIEILSLIDSETLNKVKDYCINNPDNRALRPIYDYYQGSISYGDIRFALAYLHHNR